MQDKTKAFVEVVIDDVDIDEKLKEVIKAQKELFQRIYCLKEAIHDGLTVRLVSGSKKKG